MSSSVTFNEEEEPTISGDGESEDLFGENYMNDYVSIPELDTYGLSETAENEEDDWSNDFDRSAEADLRRVPYNSIGRSVADEEEVDDNEKITEDFIDKDFYKARIVKSFCDFLSTFSKKKYVKLIRKMCLENEESLYVSYLDLEKANEVLVKLLNKHTESVLSLFDKGLEKAVSINFPNYYMIKPRLHARITGIPLVLSIRDLRKNHLNTLVRVNGIVTRRSTVIPMLSSVKFTCGKCNAVLGPFIVDSDDIKPSNCIECQAKGPFIVKSNETIYKDYQKLVIQEVPGSVLPGCLPRSIEALCYYDLINKAKPGDEVEVIGIYKNTFSFSLNAKNGFPVFFTAIEITSITNMDSDFSTLKITEDDIKEIKSLGKSPEIIKMICDSIAPSVYGFNEVKTAVALSIFGGERKTINDHVVRGDINVLLLGDPGTAKSQILRYVQGLVHRSVLATGQGSSGVGLTASVRRDPMTNEWVLEGGAMVLADKGMCLIDEFDKMSENDRVSIHEAMEQQTVSISKAGIVASLNARCGVIAAANPIRGRYNPALSFEQNVNLSEPIITRFDILCVVRDIIDMRGDEKMGEFVLNSHEDTENLNVVQSGIIDQDMLRKYIIYARSHVHPTIKTVDIEKISKLYAELRRAGANGGGVPITVRHIEAMIRMSEAFAKMRLSDEVSNEDVDRAISVSLNSFISSQRYSTMKSLRKKFSKFIAKNSGEDVVLYILGELFNEKMRWSNPENLYVLKKEFERAARSYGFTVPVSFYQSKDFTENGYSVDALTDRIIRAPI